MTRWPIWMAVLLLAGCRSERVASGGQADPPTEPTKVAADLDTAITTFAAPDGWTEVEKTARRWVLSPADKSDTVARLTLTCSTVPGLDDPRVSRVLGKALDDDIVREWSPAGYELISGGRRNVGPNTAVVIDSRLADVDRPLRQRQYCFPRGDALYTLTLAAGEDTFETYRDAVEETAEAIRFHDGGGA